jgi:hypothetical protein
MGRGGAALRAAALALAVLALPAAAGEEAPGGTLNPDEMSLGRALSDALGGKIDMTTCMQGYLMTKGGDHAAAREVFMRCADAGFTGTMTWMAYMEHNGFGRPEDPAAAAEWDRRAAEAGDPVGAFNHGVDLLRGWGVAPDEEAGRALVDRSAEAGLAPAIELREHGYDLDAVTPDADEPRYERLY